jgi:E3 ubiquitin-protein ligase RHA2
MAALLKVFSHLYTAIMSSFNLILLKTLFLIRSLLPGSKLTNPDKLFLIVSTQYLSLIEKTNPAIHYSEKFSRQQSRECAVCLSGFMKGERVRKLRCNHTFHKECLDKWLQQYLATCPLCRTRVLPEGLVANYRLLKDHIENGGSYDDATFMLSALYGDFLRRLF